MAEPVATRVLSTSYEDLRDFSVVCYTFNEAVSEKIRSLMQRTRARDYYDVWRIFNDGIHDLDTARIRDMVMQKCALGGIMYDPSKIFELDRLADLKQYWASRVVSMLMAGNDAPNIDGIFDDMRRKLGFLV